MKWQVSGTSKANGARMVLEFEAGSKADAERKAANQGMNVTKALMLEGAGVGTTGVATRAAPARSGGGSGAGKIIKVVLVLAILAGALWYAWPYISPLVSGSQQ